MNDKQWIKNCKQRSKLDIRSTNEAIKILKKQGFFETEDVMNWLKRFEKEKCDNCTKCHSMVQVNCYTDYLEKQLNKYYKVLKMMVGI